MFLPACTSPIKRLFIKLAKLIVLQVTGHSLIVTASELNAATWLSKMSVELQTRHNSPVNKHNRNFIGASPTVHEHTACSHIRTHMHVPMHMCTHTPQCNACNVMHPIVATYTDTAHVQLVMQSLQSEINQTSRETKMPHFLAFLEKSTFASSCRLELRFTIYHSPLVTVLSKCTVGRALSLA